jgi:N-acetylglucosamine-6-sulfatase
MVKLTRRGRLVALTVVVCVAAAGTYVGLAVSGHAPAPPLLRRSTQKPSIVFILTDDQRWDTLAQMPNVERLLGAHGVTFANAFVSDPLCCPSRASILTGLYAGRTGVWTNSPPNGGFQGFHLDQQTVATWLHGAGYHTALVGKYLNKYDSTYVPPGWDEWDAFAGVRVPFYYDYDLSENGHLVHYGDRPSDYSTTVLTNRAVSFVRRTKGPLFLYFAPYAPHNSREQDAGGQPPIPAPQDLHTFRRLPPFHPPSYDEANVSGKPAWIRTIRPFDAKKKREITTERRRVYQSLQAVDRAVRSLVNALAQTGRLHDTMIVFMSDNGFAWGEHRWFEKVAPYEEDIRVPLMVRYDAMVHAPRTDTHLMVNIDLAPTWAALGGAATGRVDGRNFLPLLTDPNARWRSSFLAESTALVGVPGYCELRSTRYAFIEYSTHERELYDLQRDPYELRNVAADPRDAGVVRSMHAQLVSLCRPLPPSFHNRPL